MEEISQTLLPLDRVELESELVLINVVDSNNASGDFAGTNMRYS